MKQDIKELINAINEVLSFKTPDASDDILNEMLYDVVFKIHSEIIHPMIVSLGMNFDWYDPDTSYREDVDAYLNALKDFKKRLEELVTEECSECHQDGNYHKMDCSHR